jgi:hypothetical protein
MKPFRLTAFALSLVLAASPAAKQPDYGVIYSGGSLPSIKSGQTLHLVIDADAVRLYRGNAYRDGGDPELNLKAASITEISYGQEVHRRVGTAVATAVFSLGIGVLVVLSKSKKHYIGLIWADSETKGGMVFQADKNEFRGILVALEGITGKRAVGTDAEGVAPIAHSTGYGIAPTPDQVLLSVTVDSIPSDAAIDVDGYPAGRTPTNVKLLKGEYTLRVTKSGFQTWSQKIVVEPGKTQSIAVTLTPTRKSERSPVPH